MVSVVMETRLLSESHNFRIENVQTQFLVKLKLSFLQKKLSKRTIRTGCGAVG